MKILLNIWPLNGIRTSKSLPLFTIIKRLWSFLTLQIHLLFMPLCLAVSITWHAKRTPFYLTNAKRKWFIADLFIHPPSPTPLISITVQKGGFLISCMKTMPLLFLASPAKQDPASHGDRWPPIIAEYLIDPGRAEFVFVCVCYLDVCVRHIRHACNACCSQVNLFALGRPWRLPARWPWGSVDEWLSLHISTLPPDTQV